MKHRRTREIVIELTSLLDVVMILIFAVLLQNSQLIDKKNQEIAGIESENMAIKGDLEELLGENDKLLDEKDKLQQDLQEALDKIESGKIDELLDKIDKLENKQDAFNYLSGFVYMYYVSVDVVGNGTNTGRTQVNVTYGMMQEEAETKTLNYSDELGFDTLFTIIETDIDKNIRNHMSGNIDDKYFYVVVMYDNENITNDDGKSIDRVLANLKLKHGTNHKYYAISYREDK